MAAILNSPTGEETERSHSGSDTKVGHKYFTNKCTYGDVVLIEFVNQLQWTRLWTSFICTSFGVLHYQQTKIMKMNNLFNILTSMKFILPSE